MLLETRSLYWGLQMDLQYAHMYVALHDIWQIVFFIFYINACMYI